MVKMDGSGFLENLPRGRVITLDTIYLMSELRMFENLPKLREEMRGAFADIRAEDVTVEAFAGCNSVDSSVRKMTMRRLYHLMVFHPDPIIRHEASFIVLHYQCDELVSKLMIAANEEESIVATHEALEALGEMRGRTKMAFFYRESIRKFLAAYRTVSPNLNKEHPDIVATLEQAQKRNAAIRAEFAKQKSIKESQ